jgi:hypothetical protein
VLTRNIIRVEWNVIHAVLGVFHSSPPVSLSIDPLVHSIKFDLGQSIIFTVWISIETVYKSNSEACAHMV